jgi:CubicO group peptidase (beta-lactamase class C family)
LRNLFGAVFEDAKKQNVIFKNQFALKTFYLLGAAVLLYSCNPSKEPEKRVAEPVAYTPPQASLSAAEKAKYEALVRNYFDSALPKNFNGSILVAKNGAVLYEKYCGYKNLREKDSLTAETPLQIASTSKTLTSAAVLQLVQQGKMSLNDTLTKFFPNFPYPDITVKMLLSQRSGLPEYLYFFEKSGWNRTAFATNSDVVNAFTNWQPGRAFRANSHFDYCNTNFVLLASLVEEVSGLPFPLYMKRNIFEPLHMENTFVKSPDDSTTEATSSYEWNGREWALDFSDGTYGDKNVYSTPRDLLKWDQALYTNQVLSQQMIDSAFTPYSNEKKSIHNYGLGWRMLVYPNGKKVIYHNGRWHGFNSAFARLVDEKVTIIMLSNKFNKGVYKIARDLYNVFGNYSANNISELE